ncbi:MAG: hypothetical protein LC749_08525 [Actinobacteria bacterium]|nr:hypothetical protein [Actinomycetota bacterium]
MTENFVAKKMAEASGWTSAEAPSKYYGSGSLARKRRTPMRAGSKITGADGLRSTPSCCATATTGGDAELTQAVADLAAVIKGPLPSHRLPR